MFRRESPLAQLVTRLQAKLVMSAIFIRKWQMTSLRQGQIPCQVNGQAKGDPRCLTGRSSDVMDDLTAGVSSAVTASLHLWTAYR